MLDATSAGTTGPLMDVMKRAEDIGCDYLGVYSADVLKGTPGQTSFDPEYAKRLGDGPRHGRRYSVPLFARDKRLAVGFDLLHSHLAPRRIPPCNTEPLAGFKLDGERWTYEDDGFRCTASCSSRKARARSRRC